MAVRKRQDGAAAARRAVQVDYAERGARKAVRARRRRGVPNRPERRRRRQSRQIPRRAQGRVFARRRYFRQRIHAFPHAYHAHKRRDDDVRAHRKRRVVRARLYARANIAFHSKQRVRRLRRLNSNRRVQAPRVHRRRRAARRYAR